MTGKNAPGSGDFSPLENPDERLLSQGAKTLSNTELLAFMLNKGIPQENVLPLAERLLLHYGSLSELAGASQSDLETIEGMNRAKTAQILAIVEFSNRLSIINPDEHPLINSAADAARLVMDMAHLTQEHIRVLLLDSNSRLMTIQTVYIGTINTSVIRTSEVFREAITRNCPALILVHNHPAGAPTPSPEDIQMTRSLIAAGKILDIQIIDHLIIGQSAWISLRDMHLGFP